MAVKGANKILIRCHAPIRFCAGNDLSEFREKLGYECLNAGFDGGSPDVIGRLKIESEIVFLDAFLVQRFVPKTSIKEHKLVYVPREEKLRLRLVCFAIRIFDQRVMIRIAPFKRARQLNLAG